MFRLNKKVNVQVKHSQEFFHIAIVGKSGCGKTKFLQQLLAKEFKGKFNAIFLICPTFVKNQSYDKFYSDDNRVEEMEESIDLARGEAGKYNRSLIIFDDVVGNKILNSRTSNYVNLLIGGGLRTIQKFT